MPARGIPLEIGKGRVVRQGRDIAFLSFGTRLAECLAAAELLAARGLSATVADARFAKPLDTGLIEDLARSHDALITVEEGRKRRLWRKRAQASGRKRTTRRRAGGPDADLAGQV